MQPETLGILVNAGQAIIVALVGVLGIWLGKVRTTVNKIEKDAAAARYQVENSHTTNLREENDIRHGESKQWIDDLRHSITGQIKIIQTDLTGIREELRDDRQALRALDARVVGIETERK